MAKRPTPDAIAAEIRALQDLKQHVRPTSAFGDDNVEAIDAQIAVLSELLDEDAIYGRFQVLDEFDDPDEDSRHTLDNALDARRWLDGEASDGPCSAAWKPLDRRAA